MVSIRACHPHHGGDGFESRPFRKKLYPRCCGDEAFSIMAFYVYIIQSELDESYYKGFSENPPNRLKQHNNGECTYTSRKIPWGFVHIEELATKRDALIRERVLKKYAHAQIQKLILTDKNILKKFDSSGG